MPQTCAHIQMYLVAISAHFNIHQLPSIDYWQLLKTYVQLQTKAYTLIHHYIKTHLQPNSLRYGLILETPMFSVYFVMYSDDFYCSFNNSANTTVRLHNKGCSITAMQHSNGNTVLTCTQGQPYNSGSPCKLITVAPIYF